MKEANKPDEHLYIKLRSGKELYKLNFCQRVKKSNGIKY